MGMYVTKRLRYVWNALRWALLSERDPFQVRIDACRASLYALTRQARDAVRDTQRDAFRELARAELEQIEALELERMRLFIHAAAGLAFLFLALSWAVLALLV